MWLGLRRVILPAASVLRPGRAWRVSVGVCGGSGPVWKAWREVGGHSELHETGQRLRALGRCGAAQLKMLGMADRRGQVTHTQSRRSSLLHCGPRGQQQRSGLSLGRASADVGCRELFLIRNALTCCPVRTTACPFTYFSGPASSLCRLKPMHFFFSRANLNLLCIMK